MRNVFYATMMLLLAGTSLIAQEQDNNKGFQAKVVFDGRSDFGLSYNFFVGDDADDFRTTVKGFGSGFLLDAFAGRFSHDVFFLGTEDVHLTLGAGVAISKYKFSEPLAFSDESGVYSYGIDDDPTHEYGSGFFSGDKSKLVTGSVIFPVNVNFDVGDFYLSAGGSMDVLFSGKFKRKYTVDGDRVKDVIRNDRFNDFPVNRLKWGLGAMVMHKETGISAGITYMLTPFFEENSNFPEVREVRVSLSYDLSKFDKHKKYTQHN